MFGSVSRGALTLETSPVGRMTDQAVLGLPGRFDAPSPKTRRGLERIFAAVVGGMPAVQLAARPQAPACELGVGGHSDAVSGLVAIE
jgi:hypothetical protein